MKHTNKPSPNAGLDLRTVTGNLDLAIGIPRVAEDLVFDRMVDVLLIPIQS